MVNCVNCAAPIETNVSKCPYCSTSYFDLTSIDFEEGKPVVLKYKRSDIIFTSLVEPSLVAVEQHSDDLYSYAELGNTFQCSFMPHSQVDIAIQFTAVPNHKHELFSIEPINSFP